MSKKLSRKKKLDAEAEGIANARRDYASWKHAERTATAYHREIQRLKAQDPDRKDSDV